MDAQNLPALVQAAARWAIAQEAAICENGEPLSPRGLALAARVGVRNAERVRVQLVRSMPLPDDPALRELALGTGAVGPDTCGLTLGHGLYFVGEPDDRLLAHELRHVFQYELLGGIPLFMAVYLPQVMLHGYRGAPLEVDARTAEDCI